MKGSAVRTAGWALLLLGAPAGLVAGVVEPGFRAKIESMPPTAQARAIIHMSEQVDLESLDNELTAQRATMARRHEVVVRALRAKAQGTQADLLRELRALQAQGEVSEFHGFWITNAIGVVARPATLMRLAGRFDVAWVFEDAPVRLDEPVERRAAPPAITGAEIGLRRVKADSMWAMGITGAGSIVCNLDTGVDRTHAALSARWRGNEVPASEAWYDPSQGTLLPVDDDGHGTHTMGTMTGRAGSDTIGVAPEAQWIAARTIASGGPSFTTKSIMAFEWAADPDGDPGSFDDVPDVLSNSWWNPEQGMCDPVLWGAIDGAEAAGAAVVFSAGNAGPGPMTITEPKNRITTPVNIFATGAVDGNNPALPIASFSSRGPSACDAVTIKPEAVAPGVSVRSSVPGGYAFYSGTSMACPHVAGAVALLRQLAPNTTAEEIKMALLLTARDLGSSGEDNNYGMGIIDIPAASRWLGGIDELEGVVTDASTTLPIEGAAVELAGLDVTDSTEADGAYSFRRILPDTVTLVTSAFGYYTDTSEVAIDPDTTTIFNVALQPVPTGTLEGLVRDADTQAGISAQIAILFGNVQVRQTATNPVTGFYTIELPEGTYDVTVDPVDPYSPGGATGVEVLQGQTTTLNFDLLPITTLTNVSGAAGIADAAYGQGVAWGDYDGDGDLDIFVTNLTTAELLYRNNGDGTFTEVAGAAGVAGAGEAFGAGWGDYDRDSDLDLYVGTRNGPNRLYRNNGNGTFTEVAAAAGVTGGSLYAQGVAWVDYNRDGRLDLFVVNRGSANQLFRNDGGGVFSERAAEAGVALAATGGGVTVADYDADGDADIYVCYSGRGNALYRNNGDGTFTDVAGAAGVADARASSGAAWGDMDGDGDLDLYVANSGDNGLYRNNGNGTFADIAAAAGVLEPRVSAGATWVDYDKDGDLDLFVTNGAGAALYLNDGTGLFTDVTVVAGVGIGLAVGAAWGDYDADGDLDCYVARNQNASDVLYQNAGNLNTWLTVALTGQASAPAGEGATVEVTTAGTERVVVRHVLGASGVYSQESLPVEVGLNRSASADIQVSWPSGIVQEVPGVGANQNVGITEAVGTNWVVLARREVGAVVPGGRFRFVVTLRNLTASGQDFQAWLDVIKPNGQPLPGNPVAGPVPVHLNPGQERVVPVDLGVPRSLQPSGPWTVWVRTGTHPTVVSEDAMVFNIQAGAGAGTGAAWAVEGKFLGGQVSEGATLLAGPALPRTFALGSAHPNPFNPATTIGYAVPEQVGEKGVRVELTIYTMRGEKVATLVNAVQGPGWYTAHWDGRSEGGVPVSSGVYLYRLRAGAFQATRKMVLLK